MNLQAVLTSETKSVFGQHDHVRSYGCGYKDRLDAVGIQVTEDFFVRQLPNEEIARYLLPPDERICYCQKLALDTRLNFRVPYY